MATTATTSTARIRLQLAWIVVLLCVGAKYWSLQPLAWSRTFAGTSALRRRNSESQWRCTQRCLGTFSAPEPYGQLFELRPDSGEGDSSVIWLHAGAGNGAFASSTVGAELQQELPSTSFVFPTGRMELPFPRWVSFGYDETNVALEDPSSLCNFDSLPGMQESVDYVHSLVDREMSSGVPPERIILAGFSQGGSAALEAGLSSPVRLGGICGLSTFFLGTVPKQATTSTPPVHLFHGDSDPVVPLAWAEHTEALLKSSGVATSLQIYPGLWHSRCEEENRDVVAVLRDMLAK